MFEKRNAWNKRLAHFVLIALDKINPCLLSGEFISRMNPENYYIPENAIAILLCSDERLNNVDLTSLFKDKIHDDPIFPIRIPGSVVGQDLPKLVNSLYELGFSKIVATAHADCGAANYDLKLKEINIDTNQHAKDLIAGLEEFGIENWGFIDIKECPSLYHSHLGVCLLIDGTGHRNDLPDSVLPKDQFVLNRKVYDDPQLVISHIKLLTSIPLGSHGIGIKDENQNFGFSLEHPFYIFVCAYNDEELRQYMDEATEAIETFPRNTVKVTGFLAPKVG